MSVFGNLGLAGKRCDFSLKIPTFKPNSYHWGGVNMNLRNVIQQKNGFGMLESIVALSIGIGVFAATIGAVNSGSRLTKKAFTSIDISSTKKNLYASIDCGKTFQGLSIGNPCAGNPRYLDLYSIDGKVLVSQNASKFGDVLLRAYCHDGSGPTPGGIEVRAVRLRSNVTANTQDVSWVGKKTPTDPDRYISDEVRGTGTSKLSYDWNHPKSIISSPGPGGLCASRFGSVVVKPGCPKDNQYVQSINYDAQKVDCRDIPTCKTNETLEFSANNFTCSTNLYNQLTIDYKKNVDNYYAKRLENITNITTNVQSQINSTTNRYANLGAQSNGVMTSIGSSDDDGCALLANGTCPTGYLMYGYEARLASNGGCRASCVKIVPPP